MLSMRVRELYMLFAPACFLAFLTAYVQQVSLSLWQIGGFRTLCGGERERRGSTAIIIIMRRVRGLIRHPPAFLIGNTVLWNSAAVAVVGAAAVSNNSRY